MTDKTLKDGVAWTHAPVSRKNIAFMYYLASSKAHFHLSQEAHETLKVVRICVYYMNHIEICKKKDNISMYVAFCTILVQYRIPCSE